MSCHALPLCLLLRLVSALDDESNMVQVSASFTQSQAEKNEGPSNVTYAIFTSSLPKYRAKLESTMETWGTRPLREGRFFAVGPKNYPAQWRGRGIVLSRCPDDPSSLACKEASIISEAVRRGAEWVVISGEDNYIDTAAFDALLAKHRSDEPKALGFFGCGAGWCNDLQPDGGFCGGDGYALNRAALLQMMQHGEEQLMHEYTEEYKGYPNDMATSCVLKKRGVPLEHGFDGRTWGSETIARKDYEEALGSGFLSMHYIPTDVMRWIHAKLSNDEPKAVEFYAKAFDDRGCCYGCTTAVNEEGKQRQMQQCWDAMATEGPSARDLI